VTLGGDTPPAGAGAGDAPAGAAGARRSIDREDPPVFRVAVLASGSGTNLQAIIDQLHRRPSAEVAAVPAAWAATTAPAGLVGAALPVEVSASRVIEVALVISDVSGARALERARAAGIPTAVFPSERYATREEHDLAIVGAIREARADLVVLAGYMRLVSPAFVRAFPWRIINLHPALLPAFPGTTSISDAVHYGVKVTGVTVHFVDKGLDTGPVIAQEAVEVGDGDTPESLAARIHAVEHLLLPATIRLIAAGRVNPPLPGTRVVQVDLGDGGAKDDAAVPDDGTTSSGRTT
jgi:phosphoribosylglycinamide formyltransferase 1